MKFLIDAQLPRRLAHRLRELGHDALHTLDLPDRNRTSDREVNVVALREDRVVITKDADFVNSFLLFDEPDKLIWRGERQQKLSHGRNVVAGQPRVPL